MLDAAIATSAYYFCQPDVSRVLYSCIRCSGCLWQICRCYSWKSIKDYNLWCFFSYNNDGLGLTSFEGNTTYTCTALTKEEILGNHKRAPHFFLIYSFLCNWKSRENVWHSKNCSETNTYIDIHISNKIPWIRLSVSLSPDRVAQSIARLSRESEVPDSIPGPATYFRFSFSWFKTRSY